MGGAVGIATVPANAGDAKTNNQEYAFQFGFKVDPSDGEFIIKSKLQGTPFFNGIPLNELGDQTQGIYIGTGDQNNYLKVVLAANNGNPGIQIYGENDGNAFVNATYPVANILVTGIVYLYLEIDPIAGLATPYYQAGDDQIKLQVGASITLPSVFSPLLNGTAAMATGIITSAGSGPSFSASWDFLNITTSNPYINEDARSFYNVFVGEPTADFVLDLFTIFNDDDGPQNLTYEVISVEEGSFIKNFVLSDHIFTMQFNSNQTGSSKVVIRATDADEMYVDYEFLVQVIPQPKPFLRINAGGPRYGSWEADRYSSGGVTYTAPVLIANTTDDVLYQSERNRNFSYQLPVPQPGYYRLNLHFAEIFHGVQNNKGVGARVFNVTAEGEQRLSNYDIIKAAGATATAIIEVIDSVYVSDGLLSLQFTTVVDNAKVSAIELAAYSLDPPVNSLPVIENPGTRFVYKDQSFSLQIDAYDADFGDELVYEASGLPASLTLNAETGLITGIVTANFGNYPVTVTVKDGNEGGETQVNFVIKVIQPADYAFRVNSGGPLVTYGNEEWSADYYFTSGTAFRRVVAIANTTQDEIYQTERYGTNFRYEIPMPGPGDYSVTLHFAEIFWTEAGKRIFNVNVEGGQGVLNQYDIFLKAGGANTAIAEKFTVNVTDGFLTIILTSVTDQAKISGIEISTCLRPSITSVTASASEICIGASTTLTVNGTLGEATAWHLYSGNCGGTPIASNTTGVFEVSPSTTTTYFVRGEGGCGSEATCSSITITIKSVDTGVTLAGNTLTASANGASYQWINCTGNVNITGETSKTFTPQESGRYAVRVTQNGCTSVSSCVDVVIVGLRETLSDKITVYPNPARSSVRVSLPENSANVKVDLTDTRGRSIQQHYLMSGTEIEFDISELSNGIYFIHVNSSQYMKTIKLIVN
jgi:hypothetical protein